MKNPFQGRIVISWQGYFLACFMLLILPINVLTAAMIAASVHEICHLIALRLCRTKILQICIGVGGASIVTPPLPPAHELLCTLAGPAGSFLCLFAAKQYPLPALFGFLQGIYNLLPLYPMDGGRILRCLALLCIPNHADVVCSIIGSVVSAFILGSGLILTCKTNMIVFVLVGFFLFLRSMPKRKIPCKAKGFWVQ